jgi:hypothetical protein
VLTMDRKPATVRRIAASPLNQQQWLLETFLEQQSCLKSLFTKLRKREEHELLPPEIEQCLAENLESIHGRLADLAREISRDVDVSFQSMRAKAIVILEFAEEREDDIVHSTATALATVVLAYLDENNSKE